MVALEVLSELERRSNGKKVTVVKSFSSFIRLDTRTIRHHCWRQVSAEAKIPRQTFIDAFVAQAPSLHRCLAQRDAR